MSLRIKTGMRLVYCGSSDHMQGVKGIVINKVGYGDSLFLRSDCKSIYRLPSQTGVWEEERLEADDPAPKLASGQVWKGNLSGRLKNIDLVEGGTVIFSLVDRKGRGHLGEHFFLKNHTFVSEAPQEVVEKDLPDFVRNAVAELCPDGKYRFFLPVTHFNDSDMSKLLKNRYVKFSATGIKLVEDTCHYPHKAVLTDGTGCYYSSCRGEGSGYCSVGFHVLPKVWPLEYPTHPVKYAVKAPKEKPAIDKRKFILWNPKHPSPPKVIMEGMQQAKEAAESMANRQDATFYICELVAVTKTTKVTTHTVSVEDL